MDKKAHKAASTDSPVVKSPWFFKIAAFLSPRALAILSPSSVSKTTPAGLFFGPQAIGVGIGGPNAQVLINNEYKDKDIIYRNL